MSITESKLNRDRTFLAGHCYRETEEAERQLVVRRLQHLDARLAAVRRLLEQQKDAAQDALADPALPLPVTHQVRTAPSLAMFAVSLAADIGSAVQEGMLPLSNRGTITVQLGSFFMEDNLVCRRSISPSSTVALPGAN